MSVRRCGYRPIIMLLMGLTLCTRVGPVHAQSLPSWPVDGVSVVSPHMKGYAYGVMPFADGGGSFLWVPRISTDPSRLARLTSAGTISSAWPLGGIQLPGRIGGYMVPDALGGVFFIYYAFPSEDRYAFRFGPNGLPVPGWGDSTGRVLVCLQGAAVISGAYTIGDGAGGFYFAWSTSEENRYVARLRRIGPDGLSVAGWADSGLVLSSGTASLGGATIVMDGAGGVFATWSDWRSGNRDVFAQRISSAGQKLWAGYPLGRPIDTRPLLESGQPVSDGQGGLFIVLDQGESQIARQVDFFLQHVLADGSFAPGFGEIPRPIVVAPGYAQNLYSIPDGAGGVYMSFEDYRSGNPDFYVHRLGPTGEPVAGWPVNGLAVGADRTRGEDYGRITTDMQGGVWCAYNSEGADGQRIIAQHVRGDGTLAPGWPAAGVPLSPGLPDAWDQDCWIESDGRGGAIIYWSRQGPTFDTWGAFAQRFGPAAIVSTTVSLASSSAEPGRVTLDWLASGDALSSAVVERRGAPSGEWSVLAVLTPDGSGHMRHEDVGVEPGARYAYRLRYTASALERVTSEVWVDVPAAHRFALDGARPNPALGRDLRVSFSLRSGEPASLELYDLTGRRVVSAQVGGRGPGRQSISLARGQRIDAGMYWLRLSQGRDRASARVVVVE